MVAELTVRSVDTVRVTNQGDIDPRGSNVLGDIKRLGLGAFRVVRTVKVYRFEGCSPEEVEKLAERIADCDQSFSINSPVVVGQRFSESGAIVSPARRVVEVGYLPGVMNPEVASLMKFGRDLGIDGLVAAGSGIEYHFYGDFTDVELETVVNRLLVNKIVQTVVTGTPATLIIQGKAGKVEIIPIRSMDEDALMALSKDKLFLNLEEMLEIQEHFRGLNRDPRDIELEMLAQTWSEHCNHKTFRAQLIVDGVEKKPLFTRLKDASLQYGTGVISSFDDNSGVVVFYEDMAACGKVETHNKPSAVEPYGGASTGIGGVIRDPMGTGQGSPVVASTDIFLFAPPNLSPQLLPPGCLSPDYIMQHVVDGVRDYGNRMGIPTINGSIFFHPDYRANPGVIVGAYGIMPASMAKKGSPRSGDLIVAAGGRTGRDGIHGATFSSGETTDRTATVNSGAVQIGNAIEEKRLSDACIEVRDRGLIQAITDCGAGGFSSAIGELGKDTGVVVELEKAPLKYQGLAPYEIWISESQERMVLAIAPQNLAEALEIFKSYNVEAVVLGRFTGDHRLVIAYNRETICDLSMDFLHDGLPQRTMTASWKPVEYPEPVVESCDEDGWVNRYLAVMGHLNVCSKEPIVRVYDHTVQGTSALTPFSGVRYDGPNDAAVLRPILDRPYGLVISHGLDPIYTRVDPYTGSVAAIVEALSNLVAVGGNYEESYLIDNFIWPFPDEESLGSLDIAVDACCDMVHFFERPFVSGKDSLGGTYRGNGITIKIPPVLCISAFGRIPDVTKTATADFKSSDSCILLIGEPDILALGGSVFYDTLGFVGNKVPRPDLACQKTVFKKIHEWIGSGKVLAAHDLSDGGVAAALAEMCFGGDVGADINLDYDSSFKRGNCTSDLVSPEHLFFNQTPGCFLVEVRMEDYTSGAFSGVPHHLIGRTTPEKTIEVAWKGNKLFRIGLELLRTAWQKPMKEVFSHE